MSLHGGGGGGGGAGVLEEAAGPPAWPPRAGRALGAPVRPPGQEPGPPAQEVRGAAGLRACPACALASRRALSVPAPAPPPGRLPVPASPRPAPGRGFPRPTAGWAAGAGRGPSAGLPSAEPGGEPGLCPLRPERRGCRCARGAGPRSRAGSDRGCECWRGLSRETVRLRRDLFPK